MANRRFTQFFYTLHHKPTLLDCTFTVDSANTNGLGIKSLQASGISQVYMYTSQTPAAGNPNPAAGNILVYLSDNYNRYLGGFTRFFSPNSGTDIVVTSAGAHLVAGTVYTITTLGTTTAADWVTMGLPVGTPAVVGASFVAIATGAGTGTGKVQVPATNGSTVASAEMVGNPNQTIVSNAATIIGTGSGAYLLFRCMSTGASDAFLQKAPADNTGVSMSFYLSNYGSSAVPQD